MRKHFIQRFILFLCSVFIPFHVAFSEENESVILPKYLIKTEKEIKKNREIKKKISGLLQVQIQLRNSYRERPTPERLKTMRKMGMRVEEIDKQLVYLHAKRRLSTSRIASLKKMGVIVYEDSWIPPLKNHPTGYVIASIPIDQLYNVLKKTFIVRLDTAEQALLPKNNDASKDIQTGKVWDYGYTGKGVKIAILDSGLDTSHKDIPAVIASKDYSNYPSLNDTIENLVSEHGTHVTASALGRGTQSQGKYQGIAYGADLIFLKIGDNHSANASSAAISSAIKASIDIYDADIITMSYGGFTEYNDGSDEMSNAVDYAFSKGALVFVSAGNEANDDLHYSGTVTAYSTTDYIKVTVEPWTQSAFYFYLNWFDGKGISNNLDINLYGSDKKEISSNIFQFQEAESTRGTEAKLMYYNFYVSGPATYYLKVKNNTNRDQFFHIYSFYNSVTFQNADPHYTIGSPATADNAIAVASYVTRSSWTNYKGEFQYYTSNPGIGNTSSFSSRGPRIDGVKKPDIAAPGQGIISARDKIIAWPGSDDPYIIDNDEINDGNGPADYLILQGTSMACPIAAGTAALLMQAQPSLKKNPSSTKNALFQTASNSGEHTTTNGYGKIHALSALNFVIDITPIPITPVTSTSTPLVTPLSSPLPSIIPAPSPLPTQSPTPYARNLVSGYITDQNGNALSEVLVTIQGINLSDDTITDESGFFLFINLPAGNYTLTYEKEGYRVQTQDIKLEEGAGMNLGLITIVKVINGGRIYGYVRNTKGKLLKFAKLNLKGEKTGVLYTLFPVTNGYFEFTDLEADTYIIAAKKTGYERKRKKLRLKEGEEKKIKILMKKINRSHTIAPVGDMKGTLLLQGK